MQTLHATSTGLQEERNKKNKEKDMLLNFSRKYKDKIENGEYKVVLNASKTPVDVVGWNSPIANYPIVVKYPNKNIGYYSEKGFPLKNDTSELSVFAEEEETNTSYALDAEDCSWVRFTSTADDGHRIKVDEQTQDESYARGWNDATEKAVNWFKNKELERAENCCKELREFMGI